MYGEGPECTADSEKYIKPAECTYRGVRGETGSLSVVLGALRSEREVRNTAPECAAEKWGAASLALGSGSGSGSGPPQH